MTAVQGVAFRSYKIEDEGDIYGVHLIEHGEKVGVVLIDIGDRGPDAALDDAVALGVAWVMRYERFGV